MQHLQERCTPPPRCQITNTSCERGSLGLLPTPLSSDMSCTALTSATPDFLTQYHSSSLGTLSGSTETRGSSFGPSLPTSSRQKLRLWCSLYLARNRAVAHQLVTSALSLASPTLSHKSFHCVARQLYSSVVSATLPCSYRTGTGTLILHSSGTFPPSGIPLNSPVTNSTATSPSHYPYLHRYMVRTQCPSTLHPLQCPPY